MSSNDGRTAVRSTPIDSRIKSLDGIRAVAICLVLLSHALSHPGVALPLISNTILGKMVGELSRAGVLIFFVLSGYLITHLLCQELSKRGSVSLARFWFRRVLRIFPVFYLFLAVVATLVALGCLDIEWKALGIASLYLWNYQFMFIDRQLGEDWSVIGHLWSLAVEEQFYLFFPVLFAFLSPKTILRVCLSLILATPLIRVATYFIWPEIRDFNGVMGHTMFGVAIAVGCAWALAQHTNSASEWRSRLSSTLGFTAAMLFIFVIHPFLHVTFQGNWSVPLGESLFGVAAMAAIAYLVENAGKTAVGRFLNLSAVAWLGVISYSLYIWHQLFFHFSVPGVAPWTSRFLLLAASIAVASLSFYCVEMPIMRSRERLWQYCGGRRQIADVAQAPGMTVADA